MIPTMFSLFSWGKYFPEVSVSPFREGEAITKTIRKEAIPQNKDTYILDCTFLGIHFWGSGAAINATQAGRFLVESSMFHDCVTSQPRGGAIYLLNQETGRCAICLSCFSNCHCTTSKASDGQACLLWTIKESDSMNYVEDTSFTRIVNKAIGATIPAKMWYGDIKFNRNNVSGNTLDSYACGRFNAFKMQCMLTQFENNTSFNSSECSLGFNLYSKNNFEMYWCNVIRNVLKGKELIYNDNKLFVKYSCLILNECKGLFFYSGRFEVYGCVIDDTRGFLPQSIVEKTSESYLNALPFVNTHYCPAQETYTYYKIKKPLNTCNVNRKYIRNQRIHVLNYI